MRARYPLRAARVLVRPIEGSPGWNHAKVEIRPHLRYLDRLFTLSVTNLIAPNAGPILPTAEMFRPASELAA
jgi:predicted component of type VI protein secretion system